MLLAREMGWTLEYVESLPMERVRRVREMLKATDAAAAHLRQRALRGAGG